MRRTGKEGLHSRVIQMDLKDLVNELEEKEANEVAKQCCGKYTQCNSNCRFDTSESSK